MTENWGKMGKFEGKNHGKLQKNKAKKPMESEQEKPRKIGRKNYGKSQENKWQFGGKSPWKIRGENHGKLGEINVENLGGKHENFGIKNMEI